MIPARLAAVAIPLGWAAGAGAEPGPPDPPPIENVRYTEDFGYLKSRDPAATEPLAPWGPLKYIPLNEQGDIFLTLGAEFRLRYEWYQDNNWGEGPQDDDGYLWARALPLADLHVGDNVRFFGQLIAAYVYGLDVPVSPVDEDRADALQAFADVRLPLGPDGESSLTLRPGRQLLTYGSGRLIDVRYGTNVLQSFDAIKAFVETERWTLDAFYARPVDHRPGEFDDPSDDRQSVWSLYGRLNPRPRAPLGIDAYYIGYLNKDAVFGDASGRELRHTLGTRLFGKAGGWDWDFELFYQFGDFDADVGDGDISAWSVASNTGYTFRDAPLQPRLALKANLISGDHDPANPDVQTFNPLFPKGKYFGELTPLGPVNLVHVNPYVVLRLTDKLQLTGNVAFYWRESDDDAVYAFGGVDVLRADTGTGARYVGTQAELLLEYQADRHLSLLVSYSIFTDGDFIDATGADEPIHFVGLEAMYRF